MHRAAAQLALDENDTCGVSGLQTVALDERPARNLFVGQTFGGD